MPRVSPEQGTAIGRQASSLEWGEDEVQVSVNETFTGHRSILNISDWTVTRVEGIDRLSRYVFPLCFAVLVLAVFFR